MQLHEKAVRDICFTVYNDYCDSDDFKWTAVKDGIKAATNLSEFYKLMSDTYGDTDYKFQDALDKANVMLAQGLLQSSANYGLADRFVEGMKEIAGLCSVFENETNLKELTNEEIFQTFFDKAKKANLWGSLDSGAYDLAKNVPVLDLRFGEKLSQVGNAYEAAKTLGIGLMMENIRMEIIDDIIESAPEDSTIRQGMERLKKQLRNGFGSYFFDNYVSDLVIKKLHEAATKKMGEFLIGTGTAYFSVVSALISISSFIVFDMIMDVPGVDDMTVQKVLDEYSSDLYDMIVNTKLSKFETQFDSNEIALYEAVVNTYFACSRAALQASEKLALDSNREALKQVTLTWGGIDYDAYIVGIKSRIASEPEQERKLKIMKNWNITSDTVFKEASDTVEENCVYLFDGELRSNVSVTEDPCTLSQDLSIAGDATIYGNRSLVIPEGITLCIDGNLRCGYSYTSSSIYPTLKLNGTLRVNGDFTVTSYGNYYSGEISVLYVNGNFQVEGSYYPSKDSKLYIKGNYIVTRQSSSSNLGNVIFNGSVQQSVTGLKAEDVTVTNPKGILYANNAYVHGHYALNGNPLDRNGYATYMYSTTTFDDSNFGLVYLSGNVVLNTDVKADIGFYDNQTLTVAEGTDYTIDGNLRCGYSYTSSNIYPTLKLNGTLRVNGNITMNRYSYYYPGINAKLYITGDYYVYNSSRYQSTGGTVIINGTGLQTVTNLRCKTAIIENTSQEGVSFSSVSCSRLFDHQGNVFTLSGSNSFVDYDEDGLKDNVDPLPTAREGSVVENAVAVYENGEITAYYSSIAEALANYADGQYLKLTADLVAVGELTKPLYIDLAGHDLSGVLYTDGNEVYLMDSSTNKYTCENMGYFTCTQNGKAVVPQTQWRTDPAVCGYTMRYLTVQTDAGYTAHRFYMGITHASLKPGTNGLGYKAVFAGDEMVLGCVDGYGFSLVLDGFEPVSLIRQGAFVSGKAVTLRIDKIDADTYGETDLSAQVFVTVNGETIYSSGYTTTLREVVEAVNEKAEQYTTAQLEALESMIKRFAIMQTWKVENLWSEV